MSNAKNQSTEIELKLGLSNIEAYQKLLGYIGEADSIIIQTNIFYDTPNRQIATLGYALRLRIEPTRALITIKSSTIQNGIAAIREEIEESITLEKALEIREKNNLLSLDIPSIRLLKSQADSLRNLLPTLQFENKRITKKIHLHNTTYIFEIDATTYADNSIIYELEIELENKAQIDKTVTDMQKLFSILDIGFCIMQKSKYERALEIAGNI